MVAQFRNDRACLIFERGDFVGGSVFEVNCDRHGFVYLEFSLFLQVARAVLWSDFVAIIAGNGRGNGNDKDKDKDNSRSPSGMTTRKARTKKQSRKAEG
jgi:hypothetical protein